MEGTILSHYKILRKLGEGGMGEVYLAEDTKLKRQVALKVLPEHMRQNPDRLRRFQREAEAAAALNHPNIATIYSVEEAEIEGGKAKGKGERKQKERVIFITMEYVEGKSLGRLISKSGLDLDIFFDWFIPLADALTHAHEKGVTHRDIKPGNIMVTPEGMPKILDFGLARLAPREVSEVDSTAPTETLTQPGTLLGTVAYMSPEQTEGKPVDPRSDIFSFGVLMYQVLTGRLPFQGRTAGALMSSILRDEPEQLTRVRPEIPLLLGWIVHKCLHKEVRKRYQTILEVYNDLQVVAQGRQAGATGVVETGAAGAGATAAVSFWHRPIPFGPTLLGAGLLLIVLVLLVTWFGLERGATPPPAVVTKFQLPIGFSGRGEGPVISPDGRKVAYVQGGRLWIRYLERLEAREIADSEGAYLPFWSPRSDFVGYLTRRTIRKVAVQDGPSTTLCEQPGTFGIGATWGVDGMIVFSQREGGLFEVSAQGGTPTTRIRPDSTQQERGFFYPQFLPDGRTLMFTVARQDGRHELVVQSDQKRITLLQVDSGRIRFPVYSPSRHILYQQGSLNKWDIWAVAFDPATLTAEGVPFLVATNGSFPSVSATGILVYKATTTGFQQLVWVDRSGRIEGIIGQPQELILHPRLAGVDSRVAVTGVDNNNWDIWIQDAARGTKTRLTFAPALDMQPIWSPEGEQIAFWSLRNELPNLLIKPADGSGDVHPFFNEPLSGSAFDWSRDGQYLVYQVNDPQTNSLDIWYVPLGGNDQPRPFLQTPSMEAIPALSPDSRYLAYMSDETGRFEIYVKPFPGGQGKWQVSFNGGAFPRWNGSGDELYFVERNALLVVRVETRSGFQTGIPQQLFTGSQVHTALYSMGSLLSPPYDVTPDGQRFVVVQPVGEGTTNITVVQNWFAEFGQREE